VSQNSLPGPENITRVVLSNGIVILAYENFAAQSVVLSGSLNAGGLYESSAQSGLANLTANALMYGTQERDFQALAEALENVGADVGYGAGSHSTSFSGKALAEDLPLLLEILNETLRYPTFPAEQVERIKGEALTYLQYSQQDTRYRARRAFREALYPESHPYHYSTRGTLETLPGIQAADLQAFHARHYGPQGMIITVVGAVRAQDVIDLVQAKLGDWQNPQQPDRPELPNLTPWQGIQRPVVTLPGKTQSDLVMGVVGPSRLADDWRAAVMVNSILGQFGMMGRIGESVREKQGLAYYASSGLEGGHGPGAWSVSAGINPKNVERTISSVEAEITRITTELVSDTDIDENKSFFTGQLPLQLESNEGLASSIYSMESYGLGLDHLQQYSARIHALTKEDLLHAIQHYWQPGQYVAAVAGP
jgi:zinc protease